MNAADARQLEIARMRANPWMKRNQSRYTFNLFPNSIRCFEPVLTPPRVKFADLRFCELGCFNVQG
jgi:hypothetical protein